MSLKIADPNNGYWEEMVGNVKNKTRYTETQTTSPKKRLLETAFEYQSQ